MGTSPLILIVEDNREVRLAARFVLEDFNLSTHEAENPVQALEFLEQQRPDLILLDMNYDLDSTSGEEGLRFLRQLKRKQINIPVIAMTAWSNTDLIVQAMQLGAADFIEKPWQNQRLEQVIKQQLKLSALSNKNQELQQALTTDTSEAIWRSDEMHMLMEQLKSVAQTDASILLTGENGVGKSHIAQWIHNQSLRHSNTFISLNMAAIPEQLFESELFGHTKGAFTDAKKDRLGRFALANEGSLFLDEIGTLPLSQQAKLLRVLETGEYEAVGSSQTQTANVRLISATNADFTTLLNEGAFRQDLFYRINTFTFEIPPLRSRPADIIALAEFFIVKHGSRYGKSDMYLSASASSALKAYDWPGNTRELSHMIERAVLLSKTSEISSNDLHLVSLHKPTQQQQESLPQMTLEEAEQQLIRQAMNSANGNKAQAALTLGITKQALYRRLEKYEII